MNVRLNARLYAKTWMLEQMVNANLNAGNKVIIIRRDFTEYRKKISGFTLIQTVKRKNTC